MIYLHRWLTFDGFKDLMNVNVEDAKDYEEKSEEELSKNVDKII
jgi:FMN-dependent NADH-azoreductase